MVFGVLIFIFLFRTNGKKRRLDENGFRTIIVVSPKCHSESYLIAAMFKVPSQEIWGTMTTVLWKTPYSWRFYRQGSRYIVTISSRLSKHDETKTDESAWKIISCTKIRSRLHLKNHWKKRRWHFTYFHTLLFISNKASF